MLTVVAATPGAPSRRSEEPLHGEGRDATPARETLPPAAAAVHAVCPFLLMGEGAWRSAGALRDQRCGAVAPPAPLTVDKQRRLCVTAEHLGCATFSAADALGTEAAAAVSVRGRAAGATRWAIARTATLVLEEGSWLPVVSPEIHTRAREDGGAASSLPALGRPATAARAPAAIAHLSLADRASSRLRGLTEGVVAATSASRAVLDARLSALRAGPARPDVREAPGGAANHLASAMTAARRGARSPLSLGAGPWRPGRLPAVSAPASRLQAAARERVAAFTDRLRAREVARRMPAAGIRVAPSAARSRHVGGRTGSPIGTLRLSGTPAERSRRHLPAAHFRGARMSDLRRSASGVGTGTKAGALLAAGIAVVAVAGFVASPRGGDPSAAAGATGVATGEVLGGGVSTPPSVRSVPPADVVVPATRRPSPTPVATTPVPGETYTVEAGDTLFEIASRFDTTVEQLQRLNRLESIDVIEVGQVLRLP